MTKMRGPHSDETRRKISEAMKGIKRSAETKIKNGASRKGKLHSDESKAMIGETQKRVWQERKARLL